MVELRVQIPYRANELVAPSHQRGIVTREEFTPRGTRIEGKSARSSRGLRRLECSSL